MVAKVIGFVCALPLLLAGCIQFGEGDPRPVLQDGFEDGIEPTWEVEGQAVISRNRVHAGAGALELRTHDSSGEVAYIERVIPPMFSGSAQVWFYDDRRGCSDSGLEETQMLTLFNVTQYPDDVQAIGVLTNVAECVYVYRDGSSEGTNHATRIPRSAGWHKAQVAWGEGNIRIYLDDRLVHERPFRWAIDKVLIGDAWDPTGEPSGSLWYDDFVLAKGRTEP